VVYAIDDEGNSFHGVCHTPTIGCMVNDNEFLPQEVFESYEHEDGCNTICIN
jgi:hypothetical protein